jgi:hypothetical protein
MVGNGACTPALHHHHRHHHHHVTQSSHSINAIGPAPALHEGPGDLLQCLLMLGAATSSHQVNCEIGK